MRSLPSTRLAGLRSTRSRTTSTETKILYYVGAGLTAAKMKDRRWLKPVPVGQFEFLEWTGEHHLRHSKFIALRKDKKAREVRRE